MAKDIGVKPKRITHLGSSSTSNTKNNVDYIQDIMNEMDSMKNFSQHVHYENVLKSLKKKPEVVPLATENPPEYNIHGTKLNKTTSNKYHPLMAKCQKNLKYLQHNRSIPKPRAHIQTLSKSPLKKTPNQFASRLNSHNASFHTTEKIKREKYLEAFKRHFPQPKSDFVNHNILFLTREKIKQKTPQASKIEKMKQKTPQAFKSILPKPNSDFTNHNRNLRISEKVKQMTPDSMKRSFPKPESDCVKSCQPVKKILKNNSFQNSSSDSKQSSLISKKIKVKSKEERKSSCISSVDDIVPKQSEANIPQLSEKDTDDDFESFVNKHKSKNSAQTKKSHKRNKKSLSSSDDEDKNEKTERRKIKKMYRSKSSKGEKTIKTIDQQRSQKTRSDSHCTPTESFSDEQIDKLNKQKWKKRKTQELKLSQSKTVTENLKHREKRKRSEIKYVAESSESESVEMYSNNICSDSSDDCTESTSELLLKTSSEKNTSESVEFNEATAVHDVCKEKELSASNDLISEKDVILGENMSEKLNHKTSVNSENLLSLSVHKEKELGASNDLVTEKNVIPEGNLNKKSNLKTSLNSENVLPLASNCSVLTEVHDIDKKAKTLGNKDGKNATMNAINTLPIINNEILIEISDEEDSVCSNEKDSVHNIKYSSQCLFESNKQLSNLNLCANVQAEDAVKELVVSDSANCATSKRTSEKEDSDLEIVEIDAHKPTFSKYNHNDVLATNSSNISEEKTLEIGVNVVKQLNRNNSIKVSAEQVKTVCKTEVPFNEPKSTLLEENENIKVQDIGAKLQSECTSLGVAVDSNDDDDVTILETNSAKPFEGGTNTTIDNCIILSDDEECKDLEKKESGELFKSCSESIDTVLSKEVNVCIVNGGNRNEINSHQKTNPCNATESSFTKSLNVPISGEDDCIVLEPFSCVAEKLTEKDISLNNENVRGSCAVSQVKTQSTEQNNEVKLCNLACSPENNVCNNVATNLISLNHSNNDVQKQSSKKSLSEGTRDLENDCMILDDPPVQVFNVAKVKCDPLHKEGMSHKFVDNINDKAAKSIIISQNTKASSSNKFSDLNLNKSCLGSEAKLSTNIACSDTNIQSFNNINTISEALSNFVAENVKMPLINENAKSESNFTFPQNAYCNLSSSPIAITEQQIQCKVENQESSSTNIPFVKTCVNPSNVLPGRDQTNNLNSESSREFRKKLQGNYTPQSALLHDTSSILLGNKDLPSSSYLNEVTSNSLNSLKTLEMKGFKHNSSLNELDALAESSIYELSCTGNKSILPLLNLYKNEIVHYKQLKQTVKDVDNGIRTALELQAERLKHLAFSIQNIVQNDPCFSNSLNENCYPPMGQKQIKKEPLQDEVPHSSTEDLKTCHSSENNLCNPSNLTSSTQGNDPCFSNSFFEKCSPPLTNRTAEIPEQQKQIKEENLQNELPYSLAEDSKKCSSKTKLCDTFSLRSSTPNNEPCFSNSFFEKGNLSLIQIKEESLQGKVPYSLAEDLKKSHSSNNNLCDISSCSTSSALRNDPVFSNSLFEKCFPVEQPKQTNDKSLQEKVPCSTGNLQKNNSSKNHLNDISSCSTSSALETASSKIYVIPVSNVCNESPLNFNDLPQLSLESLHEISSDCVKKFEPISIKSEPLNESGEDQYFEEEIKYSKSSEFQAIQPEAIQELRNSKCSVCNKPAVGACYFCCSVFYCSVQCSESYLGKYHRELCSEEYSKR